jgi:hypothetical protein
MELEVYYFEQIDRRNAMKVNSSLTVWKKFSKDPFDLPNIKYTDIFKLFKKNLKYDAVKDVTLLKNFTMSSSGNRTDAILNSIEFKSNYQTFERTFLVFSLSGKLWPSPGDVHIGSRANKMLAPNICSVFDFKLPRLNKFSFGECVVLVCGG